MKKYYSLFLILIFAIQLYAQKTEDVVYLKNGSIIRGELVTNDSESVKIKTCCENVFVYPKIDVDSVDTEWVRGTNDFKKSGYIASFSIGTLAGASHNARPFPFSVLMEHQLRYFNYLGTGIFGGMEMLNEPTVPVGLSVKGFLPNGNTTLYIESKVGYSISLENPVFEDYYMEVKESNGGWMTNAEIGFIFDGSKNNSFFIALGYRYNELNYVREDWWLETVDRKYIYNRISLRLGIFFY